MNEQIMNKSNANLYYVKRKRQIIEYKRNQTIINETEYVYTERELN